MKAIYSFDDCLQKAFKIARPCSNSSRIKGGAVIFSKETHRILGEGWNIMFGSDQTERYRCFACTDKNMHAEMGALYHLKEKMVMLDYTRFDVLSVRVRNDKIVPDDLPSCPNCAEWILKSELRGVWRYHVGGWVFYETQYFYEISTRDRTKKDDTDFFLEDIL